MSLLPEKAIVFYDGHCGLCNKAIQFLLKNDKQDHLYFSALQGETAKAWGLHSGEIPDSLVFADKGKIYFRSTAAIKAYVRCGGYRKLASFLYIFPTPLRDFVYDFIAKNRYKWFGRLDTCRLPTPEERAKFLG